MDKYPLWSSEYTVFNIAFSNILMMTMQDVGIFTSPEESSTYFADSKGREK